MLVVNELLYVEDGRTDLVKRGASSYSNDKFKWSHNFALMVIEADTKIRSLLGGSAIGWYDRAKGTISSVKLCSYSEYLDEETDTCLPCGMKNGQPSFASTFENTQCRTCDEVNSLTIGDSYDQFQLICSNK